MRKYGNRKVLYDGIIFDSKKEQRRYVVLKLLERAGKIDKLEIQKEFELIPAQYETYSRIGKKGNPLKDGRKCIEKACKYKADFYYYDLEHSCYVVEDTKGMRTTDYIIKRKLMLYIHKIRIVEI